MKSLLLIPSLLLLTPTSADMSMGNTDYEGLGMVEVAYSPKTNLTLGEDPNMIL